MRALVQIGECFGTRIDWDAQRETTVVVETDALGYPMLSFALPSGRFRAEYRGLESDGVTWWRHEHEADPRNYREHCLRVVALA